MVHKEPGERAKHKPRGRPFLKGNNKGKPTDHVLANSGHESRPSGETLAHAQDFLNTMQLKKDSIDMQSEKTPMLENSTLSTPSNPINIEPTQTEAITPPDTEENIAIETIEFKNGDDTLKIILYKKHNRMYRVQIFLNDNIEIRPVTYTGANTALGYWNLLKRSLKG